MVGSARLPPVSLATKVRRVLVRSQSTRTFGDNNTNNNQNSMRAFLHHQPPKANFIKKPTWK